MTTGVLGENPPESCPQEKTRSGSSGLLGRNFIESMSRYLNGLITATVLRGRSSLRADDITKVKRPYGGLLAVR